MSKLEEIGKEIIIKYSLQKYRRTFIFDFRDNYDNIEELNTTIQDYIRNILEINFDKNFIEIIHKEIPENGLGWHIDDCQIINKKQEPQHNKERYIKISEQKYLYYNNKYNRLPKQTIIFYHSTYGEDFTGGILRFADNSEILPKKNNGIIFDSREVHMVTNVKSGIRKISLVKLY